ncbi:SDR family NAD(P)-dependent oxidoreductase [Phytohabitans rumicis]|uniref:SDR family NAD(P)-dependent oxidoreductase n=1 Tax=Phytohabitans rumicis TaxID=1076125 RepID=UPI0031E9FA4C
MVITGGTDGMGAALARHHLRQGDEVTIVGRNRAKFDALVAALTTEGVPSIAARAHFVGADLSLVADSERVVAQLKDRYERIDALVLAASFIRQKRHVTAEGREASWVLFFVSKYLLVTGLADRLAAAARPVILNTSVPGTKTSAIDFDDLELAATFSFARSNAQQRRANELLGILATRNSTVSYITWGPRRLVKTSFAGEVGPLMRYASTLLAPLVGQEPDEAIQPLIALIADPPGGRTAYRGAKRVPLNEGPDDNHDINRLASLLSDSAATYSRLHVEARREDPDVCDRRGGRAVRDPDIDVAVVGEVRPVDAERPGVGPAEV